MGFPGGSVVKKSACQRRRGGFDPWVGKILYRRKWQFTPVLLLEDTIDRRANELKSMGSQSQTQLSTHAHILNIDLNKKYKLFIE